MENIYKIHISYTGSDNEPPDNIHPGWVSAFKNSLIETYDQVFGEKLTCIEHNEKKLTAADITEAHILICILSPAYIGDIDCLREVEQFTHHANKSKGITAKYQICKIIKEPVVMNAQPEVLQGLLNYNFFPAFANHESRDNHKAIGEWMNSRDYHLKIADLVYDVHEILEPSRAAIGLLQNYIHPIAREAIYLAETGPDLLIQHQIIKRELQKYGYKVLPEHKLPAGIAEIENTVRRDLAASRLSIHLIGNSYGEIPEGTIDTIVEIQNKFAIEHNHNLTLAGIESTKGQDPAFSQLFWLAPGVLPPNEKQKEFIESLKRNTEGMRRTAFMQTPLQDLRRVIGGGFVIDPDTVDKSIKTSGNRLPEIYFIYDKADSLFALPIIELLEMQGFNVIKPVFEGDVLNIRKAHINNLVSFDIAMIYIHKVNEQWLRVKVSDLLKAPGYGRKKTIMDKIIITDSTTVIDNTYYEGYGFTLISDASTYASKLINGEDAKMKKQGWIK